MADRITGWIKVYNQPYGVNPDKVHDYTKPFNAETWELTNLGAEKIEQLGSREETQQKLNKLQTRLNRLHKKFEALASLVPGSSPGSRSDLIPVTDVDEDGKLIIIGYRFPE